MSVPTEPARPLIRLKPKMDGRVRRGHPWVFSNEVEMTSEARALAPGTLVSVVSGNGDPLGLASFNPHSLIAARMFDPDPARAIDTEFLAARLSRALSLRGRLFDRPYYRLIHAEADGLPGLVVDRFGELVVAQANSAAIDRLEPLLIPALRSVLDPAAIVLRNDAPARAQEGLAREVRLVHGALPRDLEVEEGGCRFPFDPLAGQKTGWFYDHRDNRAFVARLAGGARVLDVYAHTGAFGIRCAMSGAASVDLIDRSAAGLELARRAAERSAVTDRVVTRKADAFAALEHLAKTGARYDVVIADPPAFAKSRKDAAGAARAYRKLARLAAVVTERGGILLLASCSHHVDAPTFQAQVGRGLVDADRPSRILRVAGAAPDHPVHPQLPESAYLKCVVLQLD